MRHRFTVLAGLVAFISSFGFGDIRESKTMDEVVAASKPGTLLIFDLDNTIVMPSQMLGGEEAFDYFVHKYVQENLQDGMEEKLAIGAALDRALSEWSEVMERTKVVPVESEGPKGIAQAQKAGVYTMALTARPLTLPRATRRQLVSIGIDLSKNSFHSKNEAFGGDVENVLYEDGVVYVGTKNTKGKTLVRFLNHLGRQPARIVFVDNKEKHVVDVERELSAAYPHIEYLGLRHGASDEKIARFEPRIAELQWQVFKGILSDDGAKAVLKSAALSD